MKTTKLKRAFLYLTASIMLCSYIPVSPVAALDTTFKNWKLNLPVCKDGSTTGKDSKEVKQPDLASYTDEWFHKSSDGAGQTFYVNPGKAKCTTGGSTYARSELREMTADGSTENDWDPYKDVHQMTIRQKVTKLSGSKPEITIGQIHDVGDIDDYTVFRLMGKSLYAYVNGSKNDKNTKVIDDNVSLGQEITVGFKVENGTVSFLYDKTGGSNLVEVNSVKYPSGSEKAYFKAGNYFQNNKDGEAEVVISGLGVTHDGSTPDIGSSSGSNSSSSSSCTLSESDEEFYQTNDILFYNPCDKSACKDTSSSNSVIEGNDNAEKIFNFLISTPLSTNGNKPLDPVQAAAFIGNFSQESKLDPKSGTQTGAGPFGLVQWIGGRKDNLLKLPNPDTLETQLQFIITELQGDEKAIITNSDFQDTSNLEKVTLAVRKVYERPGAAEANDANRISEAQKAFDKFGTNTPSSLTNLPSGNSGDTSCAGGGDSAFVTDDGFKVYNQEDQAWASKPYGTTTIRDGGCGPTAMATIITALTGSSVTPVQTTEYANQNNLYVDGQGSKHTLPAVLAPNWNLNAARVGKSVEEINTALRSGGLVIMAGTGSAPFTAVGHYIVIRGVTDSGKWKIADSNGTTGQKNSTVEWDPDQILLNAAAGSIYVVTK